MMGVRNSEFGSRVGRAVRVGALVAAAVAAVQAMPLSTANAAVMYSNLTLSGAGSASTLQTVRLSGNASGSYQINSISLPIVYNAVPSAQPLVFLDIYTGVNESASSASATNVLATATPVDEEYGFLPNTNVTKGNAYTFAFGSAAAPLGINLSSGVFSMAVSIYTDGTASTYSTNVADVFSSVAPTVGAEVPYTYIDGGNTTPATPDGTFLSNERFSGTTTPLGIAFSVDAVSTAVPEPTTAITGLVAVAGGLSARRRRL